MTESAKPSRQKVLPREEYIEQAYLYRGLSSRLKSAEPIQELLVHLREEILATTNLPHAIDYLLAELNHVGTMSSAMGKMAHYFTPYQTYLVKEAENERGRFDMHLALIILQHEAKLRAEPVGSATLFLFQFETICRNRLNYDRGLEAIARDPVMNDLWGQWILDIRHKIGIVDIADLVYVHSEHYKNRNSHLKPEDLGDHGPFLFGIKEGRIALANRNKENLYFFAALQRQLSYPAAPRPIRKDPNEDLLPKMKRSL